MHGLSAFTEHGIDSELFLTRSLITNDLSLEVILLAYEMEVKMAKAVDLRLSSRPLPTIINFESYSPALYRGLKSKIS